MSHPPVYHCGMSNDNEPSESGAGLWDDAEIISVHSRAQAIADGALVDVTATSQEAGFKWPVALTRSAWAEMCEWSHGGLQDEAGRLWDVIWMASLAVRRAGPGRDRVTFEVLRIPNEAQARTATVVTAICHVGPGDHGEPVVTLMLPDDD